MGIIRFKTFINNYKNIKFNSKLDNVSSLFIDANGIIHKYKGIVYKNSRDKRTKEFVHSRKERDKIKLLDPNELEKEHIKGIINEFENILNQFNPPDNLIIAIDSLVPCAKMQQQKERRYDFNIEDNEVFQGASISPGTDFMINLDIEIRKWLLNHKNLPKKVIYNSHLSNMEGEHAIFDFIRNKTVNNIKGNIVLYGADSDLFIISLLSPLRTIYLFDEENKEFYNINVLKRKLVESLKYNPYDKNIYNPQLIRDFCFLTFIIGNDFIKRLPSLYDTNLSMEILIEVYKKNKKDLTNFKHEIIWGNFLSYLKELKNHKIANYNLYEFNFMSHLTPYHNKRWIRYPEIEQSVEIYDLKENKLKNVTYAPNKHIFKFDLEKFSKLWYDKQFKPKNEELRNLYNNGIYYTCEDVKKMCKFYLKILQWAFYYYNMGDEKISKLLFYPFNYTPLLESLINYLESGEKFTDGILDNKGYELTVIHQLMLILPPQNKELIPSPFRELYMDKLSSISPISHMEIPQEGSDVDYHNVKIIPPINPFLVKKVIELSGEKIPDKYHTVKPLIIIRGEEKVKISNINLEIKQEELL